MNKNTIYAKDYKDSFFFTFGVVNNTIDVFNNRFFQIKAYKYKNKMVDKEIPLRKCSK